MADVESAPLLAAPAAAPAALTPTQWRTRGVLLVAGVVAALNLFAGPFLATLLYEAAALGLAYYVLLRAVLPRGGAAFSMDTGLAYVACGLAPATLLVCVGQLVGGVLLAVVGGVVFHIVSPQWLQAIIAAGQTISKHNGLHVKDGAMAGMKHHAIGYGRGLFSKHALPHLTRITAATVSKAATGAWDDLPVEGNNNGSFVVPPIVYNDDGTNAAPAVAAILRAISSISPLFLLIVCAVNAYFFNAFIVEFVMYWLIKTRPMARPGATLRTITASALAIALGFSVSSAVLLGGSGGTDVFSSLFGVLVFVPYTAFELALAGLIGIQLAQNQSLPLSEERNPLLVPVLLGGTMFFFPSLAFIGFIKKSLPVVADILEAGKGDVLQVFSGLSWAPWCLLIPVFAIFLFFYIIRLARKRFDDAVETALP